MPLAPYATRADQSRGRLVPEPLSPTRGPYQRDRDRIIHSSAFRRMRNKTQVFIESQGDYFRTRLTHSLEVAQIARATSRVLQVDEDLAEALALAHDLGHTCFGHAGEKALDEAMAAYGEVFDHNDQTFRILTKLECKYAAFDGLNLTWEMLEGIVKHNGPLIKDVPPTILAYQKIWDLELGTYAGIEAQIASLADDIAYNTHDFDDGFMAGFFEMGELAELPIFKEIVKTATKRYGALEKRRLMNEIVREAIGVMVADLLGETRKRLERTKPRSAEDVRHASSAVVGFSAGINDNLNVLRSFLHERMYRHAQVNRMTARAALVVKKLFNYFMEHPEELPAEWYEDMEKEGGLENKPTQARRTADYVAGMTDRFAELEYRRLFPE
jgi:dGTPase